MGYAYLTKLVGNEYFNTLFTTNFDDLINEAFYQYSNKRPIVCAHDSSISSITVTSKRPKIIKLHGDYLFDDIKSTLRETESLEDNMKNKFIEFSKDFGLIVVGYGGEDRSIMDVLSYLLKHEDYYKNGIYWCIKQDSTVSEELRKLLWKDRVYYVLCDDGFDELFAEISHGIYGESDSLPIETSIISSKSSELIENFVTNTFLKNSNSKHIAHDIEKLKQQVNRDTIYDFIKDLNAGKTKDVSITDNFTDTELILLLKLEDMASKEDFEKAVKLARSSLLECKKDGLRIKILNILIDLYEDNDKTLEAINVCDEIIEIDNNNLNYYIKKSKLVSSFDEKMRIIDCALIIDPYNSKLYYEKAILLEAMFFSNSFSNSSKEYLEIINILDTGILRSPEMTNSCWDQKFNFIQKASPQCDSENELLCQIVACLEEQDKFAPIVLRQKLSLLDYDAKTDEVTNYLSLITEGQNKAMKKYKWIYSIIRINALSKFNMLDELREEIEEILAIHENSNNHKILFNIGSKELEKFNDLESAIKLLEKSLAIEAIDNTVRRLATFYTYNNNTSKAKELIETHKKLFLEEEYLSMLLNIYLHESEFDKAIRVSDELTKASSLPGMYFIEQNYVFLKKGDYETALAQLHSKLSQANFRLEMSTEIVNHELCRKKTVNKVSKERLNNLLDFTSSFSTKAAIYALLDNQEDAIKELKKQIDKDHESKYIFRDWPVFDNLKGNSDFELLFN